MTIQHPPSDEIPPAPPIDTPDEPMDEPPEPELRAPGPDQPPIGPPTDEPELDLA